MPTKIFLPSTECLAALSSKPWKFHSPRTCEIDSSLPLTNTADDILQGHNENGSSDDCGQGHTNSTLQSYPAQSPGNKRPISSCPASYASSNLDRAKVDELRQVLDVEQQMHCTGELLADSLVVTDESKVSENRRTLVKRVKVRGLWLAKKIYKHSDREQGEREIYLQEVEILKLFIRKPHWHVILLLHDYEDPRGRGCLILSPLAQTTLEAFLSQHPSQEKKMLVGPWIGCLASGLAHIHAQKVKHKDIKPSNILIHGTNPVIADMGISHRFDNDSKSSGRSAGSFAYEAPEVIEEQVRGRRQDVWSMLCCYMEILAFLKDMDYRTFHKSIGGRIYFHTYDYVVGWLNAVKSGAVDEEELAFVQLLLDSFKRDPKERPYSLGLAEQIQSICKQRPYKYIGECCVLDDTVDTSSNLKHAVAGTASALPNSEDLEQGSLLHFIANTSLSLGRSDIPQVYPILNTLYQQVTGRTICSIRSAERKFLLTIAPKYCKDGKTYLSLSNGFIESLSQAIESGAYISCLYDTTLGEHNDPYTSKYFEILVGEVSNRYLTYHWS